LAFLGLRVTGMRTAGHPARAGYPPTVHDTIPKGSSVGEVVRVLETRTRLELNKQGPEDGGA
jgi:hypothetical protein